MSNQKIVSASAMPEQKVPSYPVGANNPASAVIVSQNQQAMLQTKLSGSKGGSPVVKVPTVPVSAVNPNSTEANYSDLTKLAEVQANQAAFDSARTPAQTAAISSQQNAVYYGKKGGSRVHKKRSTKKRLTKKRKHLKRKGGSVTRWGCLSGGKSKVSKKATHTKRRHK